MLLTKIAIVCEKSIFIVDNTQHLVRYIDCINTVGPQCNLVKKFLSAIIILAMLML